MTATRVTLTSKDIAILRFWISEGQVQTGEAELTEDYDEASDPEMAALQRLDVKLASAAARCLRAGTR